jgi:predicted lipid-binding transport protein (Tim44 family)
VRLVDLIRFGVPGGMLVLGIVLVLFGGENASGAGIVLIGSAVLVVLAGALLRFSMGETKDRDAEQAAREHYLEHGRWPGEEAAAPAPTPDPEPRAAPHPGVRAVPSQPGRARAARRKPPPRRR